MTELERAPRVRRPRLLIAGAATLVLALAGGLLLPRGDGEHGALTPSGGRERVLAATAGRGEVTPDLQAEIDRVVREGRALRRIPAGAGRAATAAAVSDLVRCADFQGQTYCLGSGWTERSESAVRRAATRDALARPAPAEGTGDLDPTAALRQRARLTPHARARAERRELTRAARSVAKVWLLRHQLEGVALPHDFLTRHPEAEAAPAAARSTAVTSAPMASPKSYEDYPDQDKVLKSSQVAEQTRSYWCGPTSMQMIAWGWQGEQKSQDHWADRLGTTSSGTSIDQIVRVVNKATGWDQPEYAGTYIVLDIEDYTFATWEVLLMRHITDYRAPVVLHPILLKRYYPYLDDDASGHYQVGRGYKKRGKKPDRIGYFEPWNQQRFDPSEPYIERVQWRSAYKSYRANQAHYLHNIGV